MTNCAFCQTIAEKGKGLLYEDKDLAIILHRMPSTSGHLLIVPKMHTPILEQVPDYLVAKLFVAGNKMSTLLFDNLNIQGTNILVSNGIEAGQDVPHAALNVLGRVEGDGLSMQWQPKQVSEEEMGTIELLLKEECKGIGEFEQEQKAPINLDAHAPATIGHSTDGHGGKPGVPGQDGKGHGHENYLLKHIRRIP